MRPSSSSFAMASARTSRSVRSEKLRMAAMWRMRWRGQDGCEMMRLLRNSRCGRHRCGLFLHDVVVHPDDLCDVRDRMLGDPFVALGQHVSDLSLRGEVVECLVVGAIAALAQRKADVGTGTLEHRRQC